MSGCVCGAANREERCADNPDSAEDSVRGIHALRRTALLPAAVCPPRRTCALRTARSSPLSAPAPPPKKDHPPIRRPERPQFSWLHGDPREASILMASRGRGSATSPSSLPLCTMLQSRQTTDAPLGPPILAIPGGRKAMPPWSLRRPHQPHQQTPSRKRSPNRPSPHACRHYSAWPHTICVIRVQRDKFSLRLEPPPNKRPAA